METVKREIECAKETVELGEGLSEFIVAMKTALADGWQTGEDLPAIITAAMAHLAPAIQGAEKIGAETKDLDKFVNGIYVGLSPAVMSFIDKDEQ